MSELRRTSNDESNTSASNRRSSGTAPAAAASIASREQKQADGEDKILQQIGKGGSETSTKISDNNNNNNVVPRRPRPLRPAQLVRRHGQYLAVQAAPVAAYLDQHHHHLAHHLQQQQQQQQAFIPGMPITAQIELAHGGLATQAGRVTMVPPKRPNYNPVSRGRMLNQQFQHQRSFCPTTSLGATALTSTNIGGSGGGGGANASGVKPNRYSWAQMQQWHAANATPSAEPGTTDAAPTAAAAASPTTGFHFHYPSPWSRHGTSRVLVVPNPIVNLSEHTKSRLIKIIEALKRFSEKWFSHVLLLMFLALYACLGAYVFISFEASTEQTEKQIIIDTRLRIVNESYDRAKEASDRNEYVQAFRVEFEEYERLLNRACASGMTSNSLDNQWTFWGALFYSMTVFTTIGYGHLTPITFAGRVATMIYAIFGIPILLMVLADLGKLLTRIIKYAFKKFRQLYYKLMGRKASVRTRKLISDNTNQYIGVARHAFERGFATYIQPYQNRIPAAMLLRGGGTLLSKHTAEDKTTGQEEQQQQPECNGGQTSELHNLVNNDKTTTANNMQSSDVIVTPVKQTKPVSPPTSCDKKSPLSGATAAGDFHHQKSTKSTSGSHHNKRKISSSTQHANKTASASTPTSDTNTKRMGRKNSLASTTRSSSASNLNNNNNNNSTGGSATATNATKLGSCEAPTGGSSININTTSEQEQAKEGDNKQVQINSACDMNASHTDIHVDQVDSERLASDGATSERHGDETIDGHNQDQDQDQDDDDEHDEENDDDEFEDDLTDVGAEEEDDLDIPVSFALFLLITYMMFGAVVFSIWESWNFFDSLYFVFISMSTIGFGDLVPQHPKRMIGTFAYLLFGLALTSMCINVVQEKIHATFLRAKMQIGEKMGFDLDQIMADDYYHDGSSAFGGDDFIDEQQHHQHGGGDTSSSYPNSVAAAVAPSAGAGQTNGSLSAHDTTSGALPSPLTTSVDTTDATPQASVSRSRSRESIKIKKRSSGSSDNQTQQHAHSSSGLSVRRKTSAGSGGGGGGAGRKQATHKQAATIASPVASRQQQQAPLRPQIETIRMLNLPTLPQLDDGGGGGGGATSASSRNLNTPMPCINQPCDLLSRALFCEPLRKDDLSMANIRRRQAASVKQVIARSQPNSPLGHFNGGGGGARSFDSSSPSFIKYNTLVPYDDDDNIKNNNNNQLRRQQYHSTRARTSTNAPRASGGDNDGELRYAPEKMSRSLGNSRRASVSNELNQLDDLIVALSRSPTERFGPLLGIPATSSGAAARSRPSRSTSPAAQAQQDTTTTTTTLSNGERPASSMSRRGTSMMVRPTMSSPGAHVAHKKRSLVAPPDPNKLFATSALGSRQYRTSNVESASHERRKSSSSSSTSALRHDVQRNNSVSINLSESQAALDELEAINYSAV